MSSVASSLYFAHLNSGLSVSSVEFLQTLVDLNSDLNSLRLQQLDESSAIGGLLSDGLVEEDGSADVLFHVGGGEQQLTVLSSVLLIVLDLDLVEAASNGGSAFISSEDTLARDRDEVLQKG